MGYFVSTPSSSSESFQGTKATFKGSAEVGLIMRGGQKMSNQNSLGFAGK